MLFWISICILVLNIKRLYIIRDIVLVLGLYNIRVELGLGREAYGETMAFMYVTTMKVQGFLP